VRVSAEEFGAFDHLRLTRIGVFLRSLRGDANGSAVRLVARYLIDLPDFAS